MDFEIAVVDEGVDEREVGWVEVNPDGSSFGICVLCKQLVHVGLEGRGFEGIGGCDVNGFVVILPNVD